MDDPRKSRPSTFWSFFWVVQGGTATESIHQFSVYPLVMLRTESWPKAVVECPQKNMYVVVTKNPAPRP